MNDREKVEPVAYIDANGNIDSGWTPLYTVPSQRNWVGLTDNEVSDCWIGKEVSGTAFDIYFFARAIETKLKEKNT
jgi:hypothetical protein